MKNILLSIVVLLSFLGVTAQNLLNEKSFKEGKISPNTVSRAIDFSISRPLRDLPPSKGPRTEAEQKAFKKLKEQKEGLNFSMKYRNYPNMSVAQPLHGDLVRQKQQGWNKAHNQKSIGLSFEGQDSPYSVSDCNGAAGPNHFMQGINTTYAIWDKQGNQVVAPTDFNTLFEGVTGASRNDGDPIVIYDDQADRWLVSEFSLGSNNYMLIAVSVSNDPTGEWYRWSFDVDDMPDYMKFGVWRDGYYMGTNTSDGNDVYAFDRDAMLAGESNPQMVGFSNPHRPNSGFHVVEPLDNDGAFAPEGTPGQFITINDDAWGGSNDEIWIFELSVNWDDVQSATFERVQQIDVEPFDSNFGTSWNNIAQPGTSQKLDAVPQILMYRTQYRNFDGHQVIVCAHTVDVDDTDHAGIRWYELQNTGNGWSIRQQSTYAPDENSRWIPAISMDANHNIALGYNIASDELYPGIRYCGQSGAENILASGFMDIAEETVLEGTQSHVGNYRWADYAGMSVDPSDDETFWFTTEYANSSYYKGTHIVKFKFDPVVLYDNDAGIFALNMESSLQFTNEEPVEIIVRNHGLTSISNFSVSYQINEGEIVTEMINETLEPSQLYTFTFSTTVDLSSIGSYEFKIFTNLENDDNSANDMYEKTIVHLEPTYCAASGAYNTEYINKVEFVEILNTSSASSYSDYTSMVTSVNRGGDYEFIMTLGSSYSTDEGIVWIDWNQDYDFEDDGEKFMIGSGKESFYSHVISIPEDALLGETRMRVRLHDSGYEPNSRSCGSSGYGEVEDYTIRVEMSNAISNVAVSNGLLIQPNPADDKIEIRFKEICKPILIVDANGKTIYTFGNLTNNTIVVETSTWSEGAYFLKFINEKGVSELVKFVVQH